MTKLAPKIACATVCLLLLCTASRSEAASPTDQQASMTDQQIAKVRELIHDTIQPTIDAINRKIDTLVDVIQANHLKSERGAQDERIADQKTGNSDEQNNDEHERKYNNDEHEHKYVERRYIYIYCCRPHCRPRCDDC
jgi:ABC-type Zn2+ transport system substrate-binding protein/surface adhesin